MRNPDTEGALWREFGLRQALAHMPRRSPGRAAIEALLARGTLTHQEEQQLKAHGLRTALENMPADAPGRAVVEALLADELRRRPEEAGPAEEHERAELVEQLERLAALRDGGHLSDAEFEAAKRKLLG
jgi:hypothetical protein